MVENPSVVDVFTNYFLGGAQRAPKIDFGRFWRALESPLGSPWSFLGMFWVQNGARNVKMRVSKAILAQVEVARGSQRLSMGRFWEDFHHLLCAIWYVGVFFGKKGFVHIVWYLDLDS